MAFVFCFFQNFLVYMFFLVVVLLLNYSDSGKDTHSLRLRTQLQRVLHTPDYQRVSRYTPTRTRSAAITEICWKGSLRSSTLKLVGIFSRVEGQQLPFPHACQILSFFS